MRVATTFFFIIGLALTTPLIAQSPAPADIVAIATTAVERMEQGDYAAVVVMFNPRLREKFSEADLRKTWDGVRRRSGRLTSTAAPTTTTKEPASSDRAGAVREVEDGD